MAKTIPEELKLIDVKEEGVNNPLDFFVPNEEIDDHSGDRGQNGVVSV